MLKKIKMHRTRELATLRDHLANERTFLAWLRTSIGIIVFGFVVEKFSVFLNAMAGYFNKWNFFKTEEAPTWQENSAQFGIFFIILGALLCLLALVKYKIIEKQIEQNSVRSIVLLDIMASLTVCAVAIFAIVFLT